MRPDKMQFKGNREREEPDGHPVGWQGTQGALGAQGRAPTLGLGRPSVADPGKAW